MQLKSLGVQYLHNGEFLSAENDQFGMKGKISIHAQYDHSPRHLCLNPRRLYLV